MLSFIPLLLLVWEYLDTDLFLKGKSWPQFVICWWYAASDWLKWLVAQACQNPSILKLHTAWKSFFPLPPQFPRVSRNCYSWHGMHWQSVSFCLCDYNVNVPYKSKPMSCKTEIWQHDDTFFLTNSYQQKEQLAIQNCNSRNIQLFLKPSGQTLGTQITLHKSKWQKQTRTITNNMLH